MDMTFEYIGDFKLRQILKRDYVELNICLENGAFKSVLVLSGSIIEAIFVDYFTDHLPVEQTATSILKLPLYDLIELAVQQGLISAKTKELATILRGYRNLIHPGRERREMENFDGETARISVSLVKILSKEVSQFLLSKYAVGALDVVRKLEQDDTSPGLFKELVTRLSRQQRQELYFLLADYRTGRKTTQQNIFDNLYAYMYMLRPFLTKDFLLEQLKDLVLKVQTSENKEIARLYSFLHAELGLLSSNDRQIVVLYMINYIDYLMNDRPSKGRDIFSKYRLYSVAEHIDSQETIEKFYVLIRNMVLSFESISVLGYWYDCLLQCLPPNVKTRIESDVLYEIPEEYSVAFRSYLNKKEQINDELPF